MPIKPAQCHLNLASDGAPPVYRKDLIMIRQYIVDAFARTLFEGNQAAICLPDGPLSDETMMAITRENNFSETAFVRPGADASAWNLRWFTPGGEIDLCGHATLASAFVMMELEKAANGLITFSTLSGDLTVTRRGDLFEMDFPAYCLEAVPVTDAMEDALGARPREALMGRDLLCVFDDAQTVRDLEPDLEKLKQLDGMLCHATAQGDGEFDCTSRSFAPKLDVAEDPVCGSGHCHIAPYWAHRLGKSQLAAYQASQRGGVLRCRVEDDRVKLAGSAVLFSQGTLTLLARRETAYAT